MKQTFPTALLIEPPLIYASLYELAATVFGSEGLARLSTGDDREEFDKLRVRHEIAQSTKLLIEVAVVLRNLLDGGNWPQDVIHEARVVDRPETDVGVIKEGTKALTSLRFREAYNKVIHAKKISFWNDASVRSDELSRRNGRVKRRSAGERLGRKNFCVARPISLLSQSQATPMRPPPGALLHTLLRLPGLPAESAWLHRPAALDLSGSVVHRHPGHPSGCTPPG